MRLPRNTIIYAYGNPGRQDDGLGNRLIEELEKWAGKETIENLYLESNYQLNIEDAANISDKDIVIFVDASVENIRDIQFSEVKPSEDKSEFTTHASSPAFILALCIKIYNKHPKTYLLHIKGYEWEFKEELSAPAEKNLRKAFTFIKNKLTDPLFFSENNSFLTTLGGF